jgi:hypothetical protein
MDLFSWGPSMERVIMLENDSAWVDLISSTVIPMLSATMVALTILTYGDSNLP